MEFENGPAISEDDRRRADTPRVNLQPIHADITMRSSLNEGAGSEAVLQASAMPFDTESTKALPQINAPISHHHSAAIAASVVCVTFMVGLVAFYVFL